MRELGLDAMDGLVAADALQNIPIHGHSTSPGFINE